MKTLLSSFLILTLLFPSLSLAQEPSVPAPAPLIPVYFYLTQENSPSIVAIVPLADDSFAYAVSEPLVGIDYETAELATK